VELESAQYRAAKRRVPPQKGLPLPGGRSAVPVSKPGTRATSVPSLGKKQFVFLQKLRFFDDSTTIHYKAHFSITVINCCLSMGL
jgi:hypothetical protein